MQTSKVSILVAVYNAEKYLGKCLDSLVSQTYGNIEILCIDDGSNDSSADILNRYALTDDRIKVLTLTKNSGLANARNEGLKVASGQYITMLDSDDWFSDDSIEKAVEAIESEPDADASLFRLMQYYEETGKMVEYKNKTDKKCISGEEAFVLSLDWSIHGLYMLRAEIHKKYLFDNSTLLYSDENATRLHYLHSRKVVMSEGKYFYRRHVESMTNSCSIRRFDILAANYSLLQLLKKEEREGSLTDADKIFDLYENIRWLNVVGAYWYYFNNKQRFTVEEQKEILSKISSALETIDTRRIRLALKFKIGYYPFKNFRLFLLSENIYFHLRKLLGR